MSKLFISSLCVVGLLLVPLTTGGAQSRTLDIYWIDVEGGGATLLVAPSGESLLYDSGWEVDGRDAKRISAVVQQIGLKKIDYFILSHFHTDHAGSLPALAKLIPFGKCFDRGDFIEPNNQKWRDFYLGVCGDRRTIVHAGDRIPFPGVRVDVVASNGEILTKPLNGGKPNPFCATAENMPKDIPENQLMVGALFTYGKFKFLDLADLDWEKEMELACPVNKIGEVTIYQTGRHGALDGAGAPALVYALKPQVVVVNNGPRKGLGGPSPGFKTAQKPHYQRLMKSPGIESVWQVHLSLLDSAKDHNTPEDMIANLGEGAADQANWIKASVGADGKLTMTNSRNNFSKTYQIR